MVTLHWFLIEGSGFSVGVHFSCPFFFSIYSSDAYSHIVSQVQSLSSLPLHGKTSLWQHNTACGSALVTLIDAVTHVAGSKAELQAQLTTKLSKDKEPGGMDASHLPPSPVVWSHVTGLLPVIGDCVRLLKDQFLGLDDNAVKVKTLVIVFLFAWMVGWLVDWLVGWMDGCLEITLHN